METKTKQVEKYSPVSLIKTLDDHVKNGTIIVPDGYNFIAAINSAMYLLSEATDKNGRPALEVCTTKSINYSFTKMVLLGLNPMQKQGYFIVYGSELQFMPSYFGDRAMAERTGITDIVARVVYDTDDKFSCEFVDGYPVIKHIFGVKEKIVKEASFITHAYCLFTLPNGRRAGDVMTFAQILKSWAHSKDPNRKSQNDSPEEMAKRTVTRRALKPYINSFVGDDVITNENEDQVIVLEQDNDEIQGPETSSEVENKEPEAVKQETEAKKQNFKNTEIPF